MAHDKKIYREVAELHIEALNQGFLARLGPRFLALLYEKIDQSPDYYLFTKHGNGRLAGFVAGGPGMGGIYRALLASLPRLLLCLFPRILLPKNALGVAELMLHRRREGNSAGPDNELLSIAVSKSARGTGIAAELYHQLSQAFGAAGISEFRIVVGDELHEAKRFYTKMQAQPTGTLNLHGAKSSTVYNAKTSTH